MSGEATEPSPDYNWVLLFFKFSELDEDQTEPYLELYNSILGQTEVHPLGIFQVKSALMKLRDWIISVKTRHLFINLKIVIHCQLGKKWEVRSVNVLPF